jgi:CRP/FNR family cyclic AMP-dependent transcriptional regulator
MAEPAAETMIECEGEQAELLNRTRWTTGFACSEIQGISSYMRLNTFEKGVAICLEGAIEDTFHIIVQGEANVVKKHGGKFVTIATLGACQSLGEMSILDGGPRSATVVAASQCTLLSMTRASLDKMISEKPALAIKVVMKLGKFVSLRLRKTSDDLADLIK